MGWSIIPREVKFFKLFSGQAEKVVESARLLRDLVHDFTNVEAKAKKIKLVETEADTICHTILQKVDKSFITPLDREDITALAQALDDIVDALEGIASRLSLFGIQKPREDAIHLVETMVKLGEGVKTAIDGLESLREAQAALQEIHRLENEVDEVTRKLIGDLFSKEEDLRDVMRWKEIYNRLENCADECEDVANIIERIVLKSA